MKLTVVILIGAMMQVSAATFGQSLTYNQQNTTLEKVFNEIKKQTGYRLLYADKGINASQKLSVNFKNAPLKEVLEVCLKQQSLTYVIDEQSIVIREKEPSFLERASAVLDGVFQSDVRGRVVDEKNEPMSGAMVIVKGAKLGVRTNDKGEFTIKAEKGDVLLVSYVGYKTQEVKIGNRLNIDIKMKEDINELDKVVIQAYGTTSDRLRTGNIATVTGAEIERQPVMNPLLALQGRVTGLEVTPASGHKSGIVKAEIRGRTSINDVPSDPLYIIDGVPLRTLDLKEGSGSSNYQTGSIGVTQSNVPRPATGQSPLFSINPADIESITVLKDADATAIYGSLGANGVILITTKKGISGKAKLNANVYSGFDIIPDINYELMNTQQYLEMRKEAFRNDNIAMNSGNAYDILEWDTTRYTDWKKTLWGKTGKVTDAQVGISGGDEQNTFRINGGYHNETGVQAASGSDQKGSVHFNFSHKSPNKKFGILLNSFYTYTKSDQIFLDAQVLLPPNAPEIYNEFGKLNYAGWEPVANTFPFGTLLRPYSSKVNLLNSRLQLKYNIAKGLDFSSSLGYSSFNNTESSKTPITSLDPSSAINLTGTGHLGTTASKTISIEPQLDYNVNIGLGKLSVLFGSSFNSINSNTNTLKGTGFVNDNLLGSMSNAPVQTITDNYGQYKYVAVFGRVNYNLDNAYLLNLSVRRDGSSRFGPGRQFGNFGALGVAWIFTQEKWLKNNLPFLSFGKLRGSYGITGSDNVGNYKYLTRWSANNILPYNGSASYVPIQHANLEYRWEENRKLEVALNLAFLEDKISFETVWYRNRCDNQLIPFILPMLTGFTNVTANSPANVQNAGWEFSLNTKILNKRDFNWVSRFNVSTNRNKLLSYPSLEQSPYAFQFIVGEPLNIQRRLNYLGVDPQTGLYTFEDKNGDGTVNPRREKDDDLYNYNLNPDFLGGLGTDITWKGISLNLFFDFKKKMGKRAEGILTPGSIGQNQAAVLLDRWQKQGDIAKYARFTTQGADVSYNHYATSSALFTDASFIRLTNLSLSYDLPAFLTKKANVNKCKIYFQGQNLLVITNYVGSDPETQSAINLPVGRAFTFGIQFNL